MVFIRRVVYSHYERLFRWSSSSLPTPPTPSSLSPSESITSQTPFIHTSLPFHPANPFARSSLPSVLIYRIPQEQVVLAASRKYPGKIQVGSAVDINLSSPDHGNVVHPPTPNYCRVEISLQVPLKLYYNQRSIRIYSGCGVNLGTKRRSKTEIFFIPIILLPR